MAEVLPPQVWSEDMTSAQPGPGQLQLLACNSGLRVCCGDTTSKNVRGHQGCWSQPPEQGSQGKPKTHGARDQASWKADTEGHVEKAYMVGGESMGLPERQSAGGGQLNCGNLWGSAAWSVWGQEGGSWRLCRETIMGKSQTCTEGLGEEGKASCGGNSGRLSVNFLQWQSILNDFTFQYSRPSTL